MPTKLNPYLNFRDTARPAMEFYRSVFGGELLINSFEEFHMSEDPAEASKVMHAQLETDGGLLLMAADTPNSMELSSGSAHSVSLSGEDEAELRGFWDGLTRGGTVTVPLEEAPWGAIFGMCIDPFGVSWLVNIAAKES